MSGPSASAGGSNPRKFSEKIALHTQRQAEETQAFHELMSDLSTTRVQLQKIQQLRLNASRGPYYGGSLPNVNQIGNSGNDFQSVFPAGLDSTRGTRHHGLVERVHRDRSRLTSPHRRPQDKHRQMETPSYGAVYLSPPPDNNWRRDQTGWTEDKRPGFRLLSQLNRTNSDSALHTSVMNPANQDAFCTSQSMSRPAPLRNASMNEADVDGYGEVFAFPPLADDILLGVSKPLPKQLWEAKKVQSLASRPKSCEMPGLNVFQSGDQASGLAQFQGAGLAQFQCGGLAQFQGGGLAQFQGSGLNTSGSLPDLSSLHFPPPLHPPLDPPDDSAHLSGGSSTGNLPAAMMHLGIGPSHGLSSSISNPSILSSVRLSSPPAPPAGALSSSPRRRPPPISPLTLSPGGEHRRKPLSPPPQAVAVDNSSLPLEPPPPYPLYPQSQHALGQGHQVQQATSPLHNLPLDFNSSHHNNMVPFFNDPFMELQYPQRGKPLPYQVDQFSLLESTLGSAEVGSCLDPPPHQSHHGNQPLHTLPSCRGVRGVPDIILTDDSAPSLAAVQECFSADGGFPLDDELHIEPLGLDGLSMLSDPDMVLPDPSVEDSFRNDRL